VVPSHVIVIDNDEGNGVTGVDVWVNGSFVSVFEGNVSGSGFVGAEVYALTKPIAEPVNRVRVRFLWLPPAQASRRFGSSAGSSAMCRAWCRPARACRACSRRR
jgi:hypothetical protein